MMDLVCTAQGEMSLSIETCAYILTSVVIAIQMPSQNAFGCFWLLIEAGYKMNKESLGGSGVPKGRLTLKLCSSRTQSY